MVGDGPAPDAPAYAGRCWVFPWRTPGSGAWRKSGRGAAQSIKHSKAPPGTPAQRFRPLFFARKTLQPSRRFFSLLGERTLLCAATATTLTLQRSASLTLGFLLLTSRELLQLLQQLVDLAVILLFRRLVGRLVAIGHLVELLLEDLGQLLLHRTTATTATTTLLTAHADLRLVLFLSLLQNLEGLVLWWQRLIGRCGAQLPFSVLHRRHSLREQFRDFGKRRIALDELTVHAREEPLDLFAQP